MAWGECIPGTRKHATMIIFSKKYHGMIIQFMLLLAYMYLRYSQMTNLSLFVCDFGSSLPVKFKCESIVERRHTHQE